MTDDRSHENMGDLAMAVDGMVKLVFGDDASMIFMVLHEPPEDSGPDVGTRIEFRSTMCEHHTAHVLHNMLRMYCERHGITEPENLADTCCGDEPEVRQ